MNPEELCKKIQEEKKADSANYEEEMSSHEYAHKYMGSPGYSFRKHLQLIRAEQEKYRRNY